MSSENFEKIIRIGSLRDYKGYLFCRIQYKDKKLSILGVEAPLRNGNCKGTCGQIVMHEWHLKSHAPGWDSMRVAEFRKIWKEWHLNDMTAGSPAQEEFLKTKTLLKADYFNEASEILKNAGLNPDHGYIKDDKPYIFGSAWLFREVPHEVLEFLRALPATVIAPAWV